MTGIVIGMALAAGALVVLRDWRLTVPLLVVFDLLRIAAWHQTAPPSDGRQAVLLAELATAIGVGAILLITASRLKYTAQRRVDVRRSAAVLVAVVLAAASLAGAGRALPGAGRDAAATCLFGILCSLLVLLTARDALKLGVGLLLLCGCTKLLYFAVSPRLLVLHVALWEALTLGLALLATIFCALLYGRLLTLELGKLPDSEP